MSKRVIAAISPDGASPPLYLLGYRDEGEGWECRWTPRRARARWFDSDEAEIEVRLLAPRHEGWRILSPEPVGA
ncbi:hypothetical protein [Crenalkalicoccus roseus]|uniref:hypothetical protein n=1 Tax=Crenalkalicoccus roseus TaxID=1485588 RepID=UPI0010812EF1|nr:hypothetical protein [Crenalkalicoccus roseus]